MSAAKDTHWGIGVAGRFTLRGLESGFDDPDGFEALYGADLGYRPRIAAGTSTSNRARGNMVELTGADDDIIEIEDSDGIVRFERAEPLLQQARDVGSVRGAGTADLTAFLDGVGSARGQRGAVNRTAAVRRYSITLPLDVEAQIARVDSIIGRDRDAAGPVDIAPGSLVNLVPGRVFDPVARAAMKVVVDWVDKPVADDAPAAQRRRRPKVAGVYRVGRELVLEGADRLDGDEKATRGQPYLVLLHGTFSRPSD